MSELHEYTDEFFEYIERGSIASARLFSTFLSPLLGVTSVLFSAATPGQGGENHINERPLSFWQELFKTRGYDAYDVVRPVFRASKEVEPWYRYNTVLYADERVGSSLPAAVASARIEPGGLNEIGDIGWHARKSILRLLPNTTVTTLSRWNYRRLNRAHQRRLAKS
jgi:hypothetical protein